MLFLTLFSVMLGAEESQRPIRVGMTPAFLHDQHAMLAEWKVYLERQLKRPVVFVQRDSYRETMDLIQKETLDFAWLCDYPYLALGGEVKLLAVASYKGKPAYQSYLIVPSSDTQTQSITDLKGKVFAYADPHSNTGYVVPRYLLKQAGKDAGRFFRRTFFTWSHHKAVQAVATGLAQGAAVDSYVWETLQRVNPALVAKTRIVWKSAEYGFPPIVAHRQVSNKDFMDFQAVLFGMHRDPAGRILLDKLNLDSFVVGSPRMYQEVADMMRVLGDS
jgi:phosphonate transport system substrate-binding protein